MALAQTATPTPTPDYRTYNEVGSIELMAGSAGSGWLVCDGSAVSRTTYANLFAVIGTTFGAGDGSTTFNLPDLRGRVPVGSGTGTGLTARSLGQTMGEETHTLTVTELPSHNHTINDSGHVHHERLGNGANANQLIGSGGSNPTVANGVTTSTTALNTNSSTTGITINNTGGGAAFNQMQPGLVINYYIWAGTISMPALVAEQTVVITVVVVFPTHTPTPTPTPTLTPTTGPSPTPTYTPSPTGLSPYEAVTTINGQPVLFDYRVTPGDATNAGFLFLVVGLMIFALLMYIRRRAT